MKMLRIGLAQTRQSDDFDANAATILHFVEDAGRQGVQIICFPEAQTVGYRADITRSDAPVPVEKLKALHAEVARRLAQGLEDQDQREDQIRCATWVLELAPEDADLGAAEMGIHDADDTGAGHGRAPGDQRAVVPAHEQDLVERHFRSGLGAESVEIDVVPRFHPDLVPRGLNDGEHALVPSQWAGESPPAEPYKSTLAGGRL